jgi:hypothetical protein
MTAGTASRPAEEQALGEFLAVAASAPSALLLDGEAGIGKTTLWLSGLQQARDRGFTVLSARAVDAESVLAYASLADLLTDMDQDSWADLPEPQRIAVDRALLREQDAVTDQRAVAAAFLSVVDRLTDHGPVLLAIDDLQWLDPSTAHVIAYAARRVSGPVGLLATIRTEPDGTGATSWLHLPRPDAIHRITLHPLSARALETVVRDELGRPMTRAVMGRIHQISAGNPFYALTEHDRLPMPFERARTQLLLGQLLRRERPEATAVRRDALAVFEKLGTSLWADRARAELAGTRPRTRAQEGLTPAEHASPNSRRPG